MYRRTARTTLAALALCTVPAAAKAATIVVTTTAGEPVFNDDLCGLNEAVQAANADLNFSGCVRTGAGSDDTIVLGAGDYDAAEIIAVTSNMTVVGAGQGATTVHALGGAGFWVQQLGEVLPDLVLQDLGVMGDRPAGPVTCVRVGQGTALLQNVTLEGCFHGMDVFPNALAEAVDSLFAGNTASGIDNLGTLLLSESEVRQNQRSGIVVHGGASAEITGSLISGNADGGFGGGGIRNVEGSVLVLSSTISDNESTGNGAGIYNVAGFVEIESSSVEDNVGSGNAEGGGIWSGLVQFGQAELEVRGSLVSGNRAARGGGIALRGNDSSSGRLLFARSTLAGNHADFDGGGIYSRGQLDLESSTLSSNTCEGRGGGIYHESAGESHLGRSTIAFNSAGQGGGGVYLQSSGNPANSGNIIANNFAPPFTGVDINVDFALAAGIVAGQNLLLGNADGIVIGPGPMQVGDPVPQLAEPILVADPLLGPLTEINGRLVHPLLAGSPAIDASDATAAEPDQLGRSRPIDGDENGVSSVDYGAFEFDPAADTDRTFVTLEQELVLDASFESGVTGWVGSFGTTLASTTQQAASGTRSLLVSQRNIGTWQGAVYDLLGLAAPGERYDVSASLRIAGDPSEPVLLTRRAECAGGSGPLYQTVASGVASNQAWTSLAGTLVVPSCELQSLIVYAEGPRTGVNLFVDDASVFREYLAPDPALDTLPIAGSFSVQTDWGSGYCVDLGVTNTQSASTVTWSASFGLNGTVISSIWNLAVTVSGGTASVTPLGAWSSVLAPGQASHSLGFCATRPNGGSALPGTPTVIGQF
jgi:hypothetical protein